MKGDMSLKHTYYFHNFNRRLKILKWNLKSFSLDVSHLDYT